MIEQVLLTDNDLFEQVRDCSLDPSLFTHENLLRLSWVLINRYGIEEATLKNIEIKENYFKTALNSNKFNKPLTRAYTEILYHFMNNSKATSFEKLLKEFPRLKYNFKNLVKTHYGYNILKEHRTDEPKPNRPILFTF